MVPHLSAFLKFYLVFMFSSSMALPTITATGNQTDLLALMAIKDQIVGDLSSWNHSQHFCQWQGITCSSRHPRVIQLNLSNQSLVGSISPHIGNLSFLRSIVLENNRFYGEIPQEIGRLFRLRSLYMKNNTFEGEVPDNLTRCTNLRILDFRENNLSGNIPANIGSLSKLVALYLYTNSLTGELPPSLGNLSSLQILSIGANFFEGSIPDTLGGMSSLTSLNLELNRLSGKLPLSVFNISSLEEFSIAVNNVTGGLPPDMGITLPNLVIFFVGGNRLSGPLPLSLVNASNIQAFETRENNFTGLVPSELGALKDLYLFNLALNSLGSGDSGDLKFITSLTNSTKLKSLSMSYNNFAGILPNSVSNLSTQLEKFYFGGNRISGVIPEGIGNLVNLIGLGIERNHLHGSIPPSVGNINKLETLALFQNNLTGLIPSSLSNITYLSRLQLSSNRLNGSIPSSFGSYRNLNKLLLGLNSLSGSIPPEIFRIPSLSIQLDLSQNSLSGPLPLNVGNLKSLGYFDVSGNKLSGVLPSALGDCLSIEELYLENNLFEGTIPQSLSSLKNIQYMDLSNNNFSGEIPKYIEQFPHLISLNLSINKFEEEVPMKGVFRNATAISVAGNSELCGGIHELQLRTCQPKHPRKQRRSYSKLVIMIFASLFFFLALSCVVIYWRRKPKKEAPGSVSMRSHHFRVSYRDLFQATDGFSPSSFVGSGSFGRVYKGLLNHDQMIVAIKVFNVQQEGSAKVFMDECESLQNLRHRNLVKILTACSSIDFEGNDFKALVFEFMPNGSLEKWLYQDRVTQGSQTRTLNLYQRLNIAIDVANALIYLHHECHNPIIHRDLKPENVLLDSDMVAHVSDFGLAKLLPLSTINSQQNGSTSIGIKGSIGYVAPEYAMGNVASINSDVYSYGILLLEMFLGRRPTDDMFKDGLNIHNYANQASPDQITQIVDPVLLSEEDKTMEDLHSTDKWDNSGNKLLECIRTVIKIGIACSVESPIARIDVRDASRELLSIKDSLFDQ